MSQPWYDDNITNGHGSDDGVDVGTPDNTPLSFAEGGQVIDASYHVYGGQVVVHMPEGYDEYWIHLNKIFVSPGEHIDPNEIIGTSGGGVGDLVLHNGSVQPAQSQDWYAGHSTGYHSELGYFQDATPQGSMSEFNKGWHNPARQLDPTSIVARLKAAAPKLFYGPGDGSNSNGVPITGTNQPVTGTPSAFGINIDIGKGLADAGNRLVKSLGFSDAKNMLLRVSVGGVGIALMLGSLVIALQPEIQQASEALQEGYKKVQDTAGKAAMAAAV